MRVLLTGAAGYIGSHTAVELLDAGMDIVVADNLSNSSEEVIDRIEKITGRKVSFFDIDVADKEKLRRVFSESVPEAVIHFAGFKAVGESVMEPLKYYRNNIDTTLTLLEVMKEYGCRRLVFSSSATVYGTSERAPFTEEMGRSACTNPYGWTKFMLEQIIEDFCRAEEDMSAVILRYFNPIGAHKSGLIGENPDGIPNNLMPYIQQVASGMREKLYVYGDDYDTPDGTGIRDYIHVVDLAKGHLKALKYAKENTGPAVFNLGTGKGYSVLEVVDAFEKANGIRIPYEITGRREGDVGVSYADCTRAEEVLCWKAEYTIHDMCLDAWNWERNRQERD